MPDEPLTVEEMCRQLLGQAFRDGLIKQTRDVSSGDLVGMANLLKDFLASGGIKIRFDALQTIKKIRQLVN